MTSARIEAGVLIAFAFVLPLYEAPKNLLWLAFLVLWLVNRWRARDFGGRWDRWDTLIALWIASGYASAAFAGIHHDEWRAAADVLRYASVLWLLKRSRYAERTWILMAVAIVAGTVVGLAGGYYGVYKTSESLVLNSVGHVNHSAIYLAIVFGLALAATLAWWSVSGMALRVVAAALLLALVVSLVWMESRGALGAALIMAVVLLFVRGVRQRRHMGATGLILVIAVGAGLLLKPEVIEKNTHFMQKASCSTIAKARGVSGSPRGGSFRSSAWAWTASGASGRITCRRGTRNGASLSTGNRSSSLRTGTACTSPRSPNAVWSASACSSRFSSPGGRRSCAAFPTLPRRRCAGPTGAGRPPRGSSRPWSAS